MTLQKAADVGDLQACMATVYHFMGKFLHTWTSK